VSGSGFDYIPSMFMLSDLAPFPSVSDRSLSLVVPMVTLSLLRMGAAFGKSCVDTGSLSPIEHILNHSVVLQGRWVKCMILFDLPFVSLLELTFSLLCLGYAIKLSRVS
jgi:hypothetical protein